MQGTTLLCLVLAISVATLSNFPSVFAARRIGNMNVIDKCWRANPNWRRHRHQLAKCSVGFAGKMINNVGRGVINYKVTDPGDDPMNPRPGTLRYAMTNLKGKVWITFKRNMKITLGKPLLVNSFTTIDGRGVDVHITNGACLLLQRVCVIMITYLKFISFHINYPMMNIFYQVDYIYCS